MYISKSSNLFFWNLIKIRLKIIYCYMQYRCNKYYINLSYFYMGMKCDENCINLSRYLD